MSTGSSNVDLVLEGMQAYLDDGTLDAGEVQRIMKIALADGKIDDDEKRILRNIFGKVTAADVSPAVWSELNSVRKRYGI